jgi:hypothetical protein
VLRDYAAKGPDQAREAGSSIFGLENSLKAVNAEYMGLKDPAIMAEKQKDEDSFKAMVMANPQWKAAWGSGRHRGS